MNTIRRRMELFVGKKVVQNAEKQKHYRKIRFSFDKFVAVIFDLVFCLVLDVNSGFTEL